ncbi:hypothetical protein BJ973_001544 [Actinoplanes tereljensis]|uniref:Uncharacterized protein n=1 Tax=Paractinoplanes tereljensis TaxID=571912 RepID=A0A919NLX8_9ACTN|nr:hypothetical protein [Actinoplanes tereljensis]GIF20550.1 hypothetical protein Ate02nite_32800 [Actinoplanes tereljensis]
MATVTITFNPDLEGDIEEARSILDRLSEGRADNPTDPEVLREKIIALLRGYGEKRTDYIRQVAQAAPGSAAFADIIAIIGSAKAIGGTHSAIERAWRAKGMTTTFISTDANGDASMDPALADIVLNVLHDRVDEPDPLPSARF